MTTMLSKESELVGEEDIVKYYCKDEQRRYFAYHKFKELSRGTLDLDLERISSDLDVSRDTLVRWSWEEDSYLPKPRGARPRSVQGLELLKANGLLPLTTESPNLGLLTYLAGLNWHAGMISAATEGQPASCPQFFVDDSSLFPNVAKALGFNVKYDAKHERYTLPSQVTLLFSELGLPSNGNKSNFPDPYPHFVDSLLVHDKKDAAALFLGSQAVTQTTKHAGSVLIWSINKESPELAWSTGKATYDLYSRIYPLMEFGTPKLHEKNNGHYASIRISKDKHDILIGRTHELLRKEWCRIKESEF